MSEMLENILSDENIKAAYKRVYANKDVGEIDGVTVKEYKRQEQIALGNNGVHVVTHDSV